MRERKSIKLNVNMYEDTKFKIIDRMEERDLINYVWTRLLVLAAKVNLCGELFLSKNIPYTMETLAIEFNRDASQVELAIKTFMELEMVELTKDNVYKVKNFAKHQNIKVEEKAEYENKSGKLNSKDENKSSSLSNECKSEFLDNKVQKEGGKCSDYKNIANGSEKIIKLNSINLNREMNISKNITKNPINNTNPNAANININSGVIEDTTETSASNDAANINSIAYDFNLKKKTNEENSKANILKDIENKTRNMKIDEKKNNEDINEISAEEEEEDIVQFYDGEFKLGEGEKMIRSFNF